MDQITKQSLVSTDGVFSVYNKPKKGWRLNRRQTITAWVIGITIGVILGLLLAVRFIEDHMIDKVRPADPTIIEGYVELTDWQTCWQNCPTADVQDSGRLPAISSF